MDSRYKNYDFKNIFLICCLTLGVIFRTFAEPTTGNITTNFLNPNGNTETFSHTHNSGTDGLLVVITQNTSGSNPSSVTYNNISLTRARQWTIGAQTWNAQIWYLVNPDVGSHTVRVNYSAGQYNKSSQIAISFTGATGIGATAINTSGGYNTERSVTLNVAEDSKIIATGMSTNPIASYMRLPNPTNLAFSWNTSLCCSKGVFGAVSPSLSAGNQTYAAKDNNGWVYPMAIEIQSSSVLPIKLIDFTAKKEDNSVRLLWQTATETNNDFFTIERSRNLEDWEISSEVKGAGNSNRPLSYSNIDAYPFNGNSYYRLKQTDFDGTYSYSQIISISFQNQIAESANIYPNPTHRFVFYEITSDQQSHKLRLYNALGEDVINKTPKTTISETISCLDLINLNKGVYYLSLIHI